MSQTLNLTNFDSLNILDRTQLTVDVNATATALPVSNTNDFPASTGFVLIGDIGSKVSEIRQISTPVTATSIPLTTATSLNHQQFNNVLSLFGDKLRVYRAANVDGSQPIDSGFSVIATVSLDPNSATTSYTDSSGGGGYWYKYTHYNSASAAETSIASSPAMRGSFLNNYCSLDDIRAEAGFKNAQYVTDSAIDAKRRAAQDEINGALDGFYAVPFEQPINSYIADIATRMAAGLIMMQQYGQTSPSGREGKVKYQDSQADIQKVILKERVLVDNSGSSMSLPGGTGGVSGHPNDATAFTDSAPRLFNMSDIQGQPLFRDDAGNPVGNPYYGRKW